MNLVEYIEQLYRKAHSQEMKDFITSLDSEEDWHLRVTKIQDSFFLVFYQNKDKSFILTPIDRTNNTTDFVFLNGYIAFICTQHLLSRFRKRVLGKDLNFNLRGTFYEKLNHSIQTIFNVYNEIYLCGIGISDKYKDDYCAWTRFGLIPIKRYSEIVFCGTTFIPVEKLNDSQMEIWKTINDFLLEQNKGMGLNFGDTSSETPLQPSFHRCEFPNM